MMRLAFLPLQGFLISIEGSLYLRFAVNNFPIASQLVLLYALTHLAVILGCLFNLLTSFAKDVTLNMSCQRALINYKTLAKQVFNECFSCI
jgi:hypothetical protein